MISSKRIIPLILGRSVALLGAALVVYVLIAACVDSDEAKPSPAIEEDASGLEQVSHEDVFLRVVAPLDEARGYCLNIPGHTTGGRLESPMQAHTCKHGIWNQDGRFDLNAPGNGTLRMPHYELCLGVESALTGAQLLLAECTGASLQSWMVQDSGEIVLEDFPEMCITIDDGRGRDAGGPQYLMKGVGLDTCAPLASDRQRWTPATPR